MPAPAMPITMRGDGRGTQVRQKQVPLRHFAGKGQDIPGDDDDDDDEEEGQNDDTGTVEQENDDADGADSPRKALAVPNIDLKDINLRQHYERDSIYETQRLKDVNEAGDEESEYETDEGGSEESEEDEDEEEEEAPRRVLPKPTFISKSTRHAPPPPPTASPTVTAARQVEEDLDEQQRRKVEARKALEHSIRTEHAARDTPVDVAADDVDDTDVPNDDAAFQAWKLRELQRLKRDRDAIEAKEREREELDARMALPESVRIEEAEQERRDAIAQKRADREERNMGGSNGGTHEKYHHRGGFYQDDPVVKRRLQGTIENTGAGQGLRGATRKAGNLLSQDTSRDSMWQQRKKQRT